MFGVVLWSDTADRKAVFWCEDQGDLAFFDATKDRSAPDVRGFFDAGDMVQFDVHVERKTRKASNPRLIERNACTDLPDVLRCDARACESKPSKKWCLS